MKRDFLKSLGIEDKEVIDKILDENSSDIGRAKGELQTYKDKVTELEGEIRTKDGKITELETKAGKVTELEEKVTQLESDKTKLQSDLDTRVTALQKSHAIENGVRDAKAKNVKAVMALLDLEKITYADGKLDGLSTQLETLTKGEDTSFLFGGTKGGLAGTEPGNPLGNGGTPPTAKTFAEAVANALNNNK